MAKNTREKYQHIGSVVFAWTKQKNKEKVDVRAVRDVREATSSYSYTHTTLVIIIVIVITVHHYFAGWK